MTDSRYTWVAFYTELADKLIAFKDDRQELIRDLQALYRDIGIKLPKLDSLETPADIDPYTVFGLFNKGITEANRKKIISGMAGRFGVAAPQPQDFTGLPVLNNLNATFYAFSDDERRGKRDIDNLWRVFEAELALSAEDDEPNRKAFVGAFDDTVGQFGLGWKLTMGLYWARPHDFINLDSRNRWFMGDEAKAGTDIANVFPKEKDAALHDGTRYLSICDAVKAELGTDECPYESLPELSGAAFAESERVNREKKAAAKAAEQEAEENALGDADVETVHYWLYAPGEGASMWDDFYERGVMGLGWSELGDLESYGSKEEMRLKLQEIDGAETSQNNSAHAVWQFAHDIKPGDVVYAKRGRSEIIGRGVVAGGYAYDAAGGLYPSTREVRWTRKGSWRYDGMFAMKTLTDITDYPEVVGKIGALFDDEDELEAQPAAAEYPAYGKEDFLSEVFMAESQYDTLVGVLRAKKNVILQGAPGVGKTFAAKRLAYSMMGLKDPDRVQMVQFHQSYSYEDFIEGYRPSADGFELAKGSFYTFCKKAADDSDNDYFFIIDEINRGNLSKIFGELFMLIENDKRGPKNKLQLLYSRELFYVPGNVYLIGMMNTADRSLAMLDYALRRRFAFFDLRPGFETEGFKAYREGLGSAKLDALVAAVERLNAAIAEDDTLGEGFCIGHSYFCGLKPGDVTDAKLSAIVEYELVPMLREYWFDDPAKVREWSDALRRAVK
jgi:5-methylcytosine-specific restriction protein B